VENLLLIVGGGVLVTLLLIAGLVLAVIVRGWLAARDANSENPDLGDVLKRFDRLESQVKLLRTEWGEVHSRLDTVVRRGVRLGVLERKDGEGPPPAEPPPPTTRAELLKRWREAQR